MSRICKNFLIFFLMLLPVAAFADLSSSLNFFSPPENDFSLNLLERAFGSIGNVLHGSGNQIIGIILGVFNAMWVIVVGLGILFVVWDSVITAAQSGEIMQARGKKTVFTVLRIVIGFALVVPSKSTGYSMAQNGVMWVVVQGVGLADQITQKLHDYLQADGQPFTTKPSTAADKDFLILIGADILKSEVCMYKLQDIVDNRNKEHAAAMQEAGISGESTNSELAKVGYSVNLGDYSGNIVFGSKNPAFDSSKANSSEYLSECGETSWTLNITLPVTNETDAEIVAKIKKTSAGYMQAAVTEMVLNLQPVARELASLNSSDADNSTKLNAIVERAATAMAGAATSYATLLDPLKHSLREKDQAELQNSLTTLNGKGWIFTPMMVIAPGLYNPDSTELASFAPTVELPDVAGSTVGVFKELNGLEKQQIIAAMSTVDTGNFITKAKQYLVLMDAHNESPGIDFTSIYAGTPDSSYIDGLGSVFDATKATMDAGATTAYGLLWIPKGTAVAFKAVGDFFGANTEPFDNGINMLDSAQNSVYSMVNNAKDNLNALARDIEAAAPMAIKGGMTSELVDMTNQLGPLGPMFATIMTAMIGKSIDGLQTNLFDSNLNAMASSIKVGGEMMVTALESTFQSGKILFVSTLVKAGIDGLGQIVSAIPYVGGAIGGIMGIGTNLVHKGIESFATFHIALAVMLFAGGVLLYIVVPLTFVVAFAAVCLRWLGMVMINILGAPIFCFNLIRSDGEGMIGHGQRFLGDLAKTALTPAILTIGAVVYLLLFNIGYILITAILTQFLPILSKAYNNALLVPISLAMILMIFSTLMVYISQTLANLCTTELVNQVASTIGETIQNLEQQGASAQMKDSATSGAKKGSAGIKSMTSSGSGMGPRI